LWAGKGKKGRETGGEGTKVNNMGWLGGKVIQRKRSWVKSGPDMREGRKKRGERGRAGKGKVLKPTIGGTH